MKVRIYPTKSQTQTFEKIMIGANCFYNMTIKYLMEMRDNIMDQIEDKLSEIPSQYHNYNFMSKFIDKTKIIPTFFTVRNNIIPRKIPEDSPLIWMKEVPDHAKGTAINDAYTSFVTNIKKCMVSNNNIMCKARLQEKKEYTPCSFDMTRRTEKVSFGVVGRSINLKKRQIMPRIIKGSVKFHKKDYEKIKNEKIGDSRIIYQYPDRWYLCAAFVKLRIVLEDQKHNCVSMDPGVRTFQTFYSPDGTFGKIGDNVNKKLYGLGLKIDNMQSAHDNLGRNLTRKRKRKRYRIRKKMARVRLKIKNITNDLHHKAADFFTKNFKSIIIPNTNISRMIRR